MSGNLDWSRLTPDSAKPVDLRTNQPHSARVYDYMLGGKDNFAADRKVAEEVMALSPYLRTSVRANRNFMIRVARHLASDLGISQFLDIGTGLPTSPNLHEVVQQVNPDARIVYIDNDPIVLQHARALLVGTPTGRTTYIDADIHDPQGILNAAETQNTLDLSKPVALCLIAILHFIPDENEAHEIVRELMRPLPSGSALALSTIAIDAAPERVTSAVKAFNARGIASKTRTRAEVDLFFEGLDIVPPGLVPVHHWHPDDEARSLRDDEVSMYGGIGVKR
ncbi:SAM-dependent methyltransferase [Streptosporangium sp. NPDC001559]|uniref:SAM-dependent methyltransferase n=1 Tax=Streptosporangium sp. NPDC001559 TaxID=3366187 RepID=UPI0036E97E18